ncbi:uncharacterized protein LOC109846036 [Asparagus officinalis]|uniref:uncharacterized protein LOC109846036 n=1 Tax=Asparagus officinalis TaxID=4686 RepID=UPI00098E285C|nr:uncharacterized protein LOC109846036 [Asparagus officinalis]
MPWIIFGDFNTVLCNEEKLGGSPVTDSDTLDFRSFIDDCQLCHMKTLGCFFTWNNKQDPDTRVWSRLDRTLINDNWIQQLNSSHVEFMVPRLSDHSPGIISVYEDCSYGKKPFRFFNMWTKHADFLPTVSHIWLSQINGFHMYSVCTKLKRLKGALKSLNRRHFCNISEQVIRAKIEMEKIQKKLQDDPLNPTFICQERKSIALYNKLLDHEISFYQQKAITAWSIQGDRNTALFHSAIKANMHNNRVSILYNSHGDRLTDGEEIVKEFVSYYKSLMGTTIHTVKPDKHIIQNGACLNSSQARELSKPVKSEEIRAVIFSMPDNKAPSPMGLMLIFTNLHGPSLGRILL